jgi:hypothetical protein
MGLALLKIGRTKTTASVLLFHSLWSHLMAEYEIEVLGVVLIGVFQYLRCTRNKQPFITYYTVHNVLTIN